MLVPAPYKAPEMKAEKKAPGTRKGLRRKVVPEASSEDDEANSSPEGEEEGEDAPPLVGGDKKRKAAPTGRGEGSKKGRTLLPDYSTTAAEGEDKWLLRAKPLAKS